MGTKDDIIAAIQVVADATLDGNMRISLGAPGDNVENSIGAWQPTGAAWVPEPKTWPVVVQGFASWMDSHGVGRADVFTAVNVFTVSGNITINHWVVEMNAAGITLTLPAASAVPRGKQVIVKDVFGSPANGVGPTGVDTIDGAPGPILTGPNGAIRLYSDGVSDWRTW